MIINYLFVHLFVYLFSYLVIYLVVYLFIYLFIYLYKVSFSHVYLWYCVIARAGAPLFLLYSILLVHEQSLDPVGILLRICCVMTTTGVGLARIRWGFRNTEHLIEYIHFFT